MSRKHLSYRSFAPAVIEATDELFASKPWRQDEDQQGKFEKWTEAVAKNYGMKTPQLIVSPIAFTSYDPEHNTIYLNRFSVTNLFVTTRLALLEHGHSYPAVEGRGLAEDAIRWGVSLFYKVRPRLFRKAVRAGGIEGVDAWDLVPSNAEQALCKHCEYTIWKTQDGKWRHVNTGWIGCPEEYQPEHDALADEDETVRYTATPAEASTS